MTYTVLQVLESVRKAHFEAQHCDGLRASYPIAYELGPLDQTVKMLLRALGYRYGAESNIAELLRTTDTPTGEILERYLLCDWQTATYQPMPVRCHELAAPDSPWCPSHIADALDNWPHAVLPKRVPKDAT